MWCRWGKTITTIAFGITASLASYELASVAQMRNPAKSPSRTATPVQSSTPSQKSAVSQIRSYTPSEIRAALRGLGYNVQQEGATLTDQGTRNAIRAFQRSYKLSAIDGVAGPNTQAVMATLVRNLHRNLNLVLKPSKPLPISQYYTPASATAVEQFQKQINFPTTGIATVTIRSRLDQEAKRVLGSSTSPGQTTTPTTSPTPTPTASPTPTTSPSPEASPSVSPTIPEVSPSPTPTPSASPTIPEVSPSPTPTTSP